MSPWQREDVSRSPVGDEFGQVVKQIRAPRQSHIVQARKRRVDVGFSSTCPDGSDKVRHPPSRNRAAVSNETDGAIERRVEQQVGVHLKDPGP